MPEQRTNGGAPRIPEISVREAWERLEDGARRATLLDVREAWEYQEGHARGARLLPLSELMERLDEVPRGRELLVICHVGQRSLAAAQYLQRQGFAEVANVAGGTDAWEEAGLPMERGAE